MKKIFITGICGFVGSNLANFYYDKNYYVSGIDNLSRKGSYKNFIKLKKKGINIFKGNLCNKNSLNNFLKKKYKFNNFIHCAAYTSVLDGTNAINSKKLYENNILSTLNSLELANHFDSNFIYISSSRVYSIDALENINLRFKKIYKPINNLGNLTNRGINEKFSTSPPLSLYGSSKIICENIVQEYCILKKIPFIINRCGLLAGKGQLYKNDQGIISFWINSWKKDKKLSYIGFKGSGYQTRDCLHPNDLANLITLQIKKIKKLRPINRIFNVSGGSESAFSLKELSDWCCKNIFKKKINGIKKGRIFDAKWIVLDNSKARKEFKWKPKYEKNLIFKNILN
jgi:CDP-paratose 2-epimerase